MLKSYSVIRSFGHVLALSSCGWKSPSVLCTLMLLASCNGGGSSGGGGGVIVTTAPSAPSSLSLATPGSSPGLDSTPTISVGGVVSGNTVRLFSDSACATTEIGSAVSSDTSVNITVSFPLSVSSHTIYANATNAIGTSPCSSSYVSYEPVCPPEFVLVPFNSSVGTTSNFCVMKYEAKNNGSGVAVSLAAGNPYVSLTIGDSQTKCTDLNALNGVSGKFDLISNPEWMTIARNAESVSSNFEANVMARGWSRSNTGVAPSTDANCLYNAGANTCASSGDHLYRRTLTLSNGEEIWDLSGNVWEWVDWDSAMAGPQEGPKTCAGLLVEFPVAASYACLSGLADQVFPATSNGSSVEGFGIFMGDSGGVALRGGGWDSGWHAGAFSLRLDLYYDDSGYSWMGFRCVYRP